MTEFGIADNISLKKFTQNKNITYCIIGINITHLNKRCDNVHLYDM